MGGGDRRTGKDPGHNPHEALEAWTRERFPTLGQVLHRWSGQVLEPVDAPALTGRATDSEHVFIHRGDSGQGMTHGMNASVLLDDLISGRPNPWAQLHQPSRLRLRAVPKYARVAAATGRLLNHLLPGQAGDVEEIPRGAGAILKREGQPVAVYRDDNGQLPERSAVCTHQGCVVDWSAEDPGWDCPRRGSRFDPLGKVVSGPALADLSRAVPEAQPKGRRAG